MTFRPSNGAWKCRIFRIASTRLSIPALAARRVPSRMPFTPRGERGRRREKLPPQQGRHRPSAESGPSIAPLHVHPYISDRVRDPLGPLSSVPVSDKANGHCNCRAVDRPRSAAPRPAYRSHAPPILHCPAHRSVGQMSITRAYCVIIRLMSVSLRVCASLADSPTRRVALAKRR